MSRKDTREIPEEIAPPIIPEKKKSFKAPPPRATEESSERNSPEKSLPRKPVHAPMPLQPPEYSIGGKRVSPALLKSRAEEELDEIEEGKGLQVIGSRPSLGVNASRNELKAKGTAMLSVQQQPLQPRKKNVGPLEISPRKDELQKGMPNSSLNMLAHHQQLAGRVLDRNKGHRYHEHLQRISDVYTNANPSSISPVRLNRRAQLEAVKKKERSVLLPELQNSPLLNG